MSIPASTVSGGHPTDGEIVDNQAAINALLGAFAGQPSAVGAATQVLHGNAAGFAAVSLTADVAGTLPIANGGTNGTVAAVNGAVVYSTASAYALTAAGTSGQILQSAGAASPVWAGETAWTAPTLSGAWANVGAPYLSAGYMKDANGRVHLRGSIKSGAVPSSAFTLAAGYRPSASAVFPQVDGVNALAVIIIAAAGTVTVQQGNNAQISLDGITFDTR